MKWVVMAERGYYSDRETWPVAVFDTIEDARVFMKKTESCCHHADQGNPRLARYVGASFEIIGLDLGRMTELVDKWLEAQRKFIADEEE